MMTQKETESELSRSEVVATIAAELEKKGPLPKGTEVEAFDFISSGQINSLALLGFITELEERFDIEFEDCDFESESFKTVGGLAALIISKR